MRTTTASIRSLIEKIDRGDIRLPEIQRGYVWKPPKVAGLVDSLYRGYPTGSLLLWETDEEIVERDAAIVEHGAKPMAKPLYLIDGQQRLTSLHRALMGHEDAQIVFNVESERFQNESSATQKDPKWIRVYDVVNEAADLFVLVGDLHERLPGLEPNVLHGRLHRLRTIADYSYWIEIVDDLPYEEVADIFVRLNSRGVTLRSVDLALATLSARWRGVIAKLDEEAGKWSSVGYSVVSVGFLARCLAALATEAGGFNGFVSASTDELETAWQRTQRGVEHLVHLLKNTGGIATSELLPSENALVPLVVHLGLRPDEALFEEHADAILYWLFGAFIQGRYSGSVATVLAQDLAAIRSSTPLEGLFKNLRLFGQKLVVTEASLTGRTERSPYFLLSYLVARQSGARDWWYGVDICTDAQGQFKLEYHHIHPRATLRDTYSKTQINDLANFAFISSKANRKISDRSPASYFPEIGDEQLAAHLVPLGIDLRTPDGYPDFVRDRRILLAEAMTELLDAFAPSSLTGAEVAEDPTAGETLTLSLFGSSRDDPNAVLCFVASAHGDVWHASVSLRDVLMFLTDLENGYSAALEVAGETVELEAGVDAVQLPLGPFIARGTLEEWRAVVEREVVDIAPLEEMAEARASATWSRDRTQFPIMDSE